MTQASATGTDDAFAAGNAITLVTVIHAGELPLLALQARSVGLHAAQAGIAEIMILINDCNEDLVRACVEAIIPHYGPMADRVRVLGSAEVLAGSPAARGLRGRVFDLFARNPRWQGINRSGWRGNDGWRMQQAFKLAAARGVTTSHVVFLDGKNIFTGAVTLEDFIAPDGRPRTRFQATGPHSDKWMRASGRALGTRKLPMPAEITTYVTPFCCRTALLRQVLDALELRNGPVAGFFAFRLNNATEFTLINVYCVKQGRALRDEFAEGILPSFTLWGDQALMDLILQDAREKEARCIGLHRLAMPKMRESQRVTVADMLVKGGVINAPEELDGLMNRDGAIAHG